MKGAPQAGRCRSRCALPAAFVAVLLIGAGLGVLLERVWLRPDAGKAAAAEDPRLLGKWIDETKQTPLEFKPDGTFEYVRVTTSRFIVNGEPDTNAIKAEDRITGQYRWVDKETIELIEPDIGIWLRNRISFDGDNKLNLLLTDGKVRRYTRTK